MPPLPRKTRSLQTWTVRLPVANDATSDQGVSDRAKAILHPVRAQMVVALHDRALTAAQIADLLRNVPLGTVYRHLGVLLDAQIVQVAERRKGVRGEERVYTLVEEASYVTANEVTPQTMTGLVAALTGVVQAAFARYAETGPFPPSEGNLSFVAKSVRLTPSEYQALRTHVREALTRKASESNSDTAERRLIAFFSVPDKDEPQDTDADKKAEAQHSPEIP